MPVATSTATMPPVARCTMRSAEVNRGARLAGRGIVASVGMAHPGVDVVPLPLPVPGDDPVDNPDLGQPLARLVAVHRRDEQAGRTTVPAADGLAVEQVD